MVERERRRLLCRIGGGIGGRGGTGVVLRRAVVSRPAAAAGAERQRRRADPDGRPHAAFPCPERLSTR
jgi:hypothetical protein